MKDINIYLVDDDDNGLFITKRFIRKADPSLIVTCFLSSQELVEKLKSEEVDFPDIIITDLNMPILSGFEMMDQISKLPKFNSSTKTYIQSALINPVDMEVIEKSPVYAGHFEKFISIEKAIEIVEDYKQS